MSRAEGRRRQAAPERVPLRWVAAVLVVLYGLTVVVRLTAEPLLEAYDGLVDSSEPALRIAGWAVTGPALVYGALLFKTWEVSLSRRLVFGAYALAVVAVVMVAGLVFDPIGIALPSRREVFGDAEDAAAFVVHGLWLPVLLVAAGGALVAALAAIRHWPASYAWVRFREAVLGLVAAALVVCFFGRPG